MRSEVDRGLRVADLELGRAVQGERVGVGPGDRQRLLERVEGGPGVALLEGDQAELVVGGLELGVGVGLLPALGQVHQLLEGCLRAGEVLERDEGEPAADEGGPVVGLDLEDLVVLITGVGVAVGREVDAGELEPGADLVRVLADRFLTCGHRSLEDRGSGAPELVHRIQGDDERDADQQHEQPTDDQSVERPVRWSPESLRGLHLGHLRCGRSHDRPVEGHSPS